jgi:hypothetical protein
MIAADTSTWIAFFEGEAGNDVEVLDQSLQTRQVLMVPPVLTELLSDPKITPKCRILFQNCRSLSFSQDSGPERARFAQAY